jgi:cell wall-associated NlpC family hydrolase
MSPKLHLRRKAVKVVVALGATLACIAALATVPLAGADQLSSDRAEAAYLANQINTLGLREGALGEQYDAGVLVLQNVDAHMSADKKHWAAADAKQQRTINLLRQAAVEAYTGGAQMPLAKATAMKNANDDLLRQELEQTFAANQSDALDSYRLAAAEAATAYAQWEKDRDAKAQQLAVLKKDRQQVQAAEYKLEALQAQVKGRIATLVAQIEREKQLAEQRAEEALLAKERAQAAAAAKAEAEAQAAAERAAAAREAQAQAEAARQAQEEQAADPTATTVPPTPVTTTITAEASNVLPGENPNAPGAIAAAESRVGDPYVWAAAGPDAFDCSGLVMWSWAQVGVYLPHNAAAQYSVTVHIPMTDLMPGDLVYPAGLFHVAMYIGNGEIVQAPYTGADVQIVPLTGFFQLASRVG